MRQWTVDAFADRPFRGNPACILAPFDTWPHDAWMQALAEENKQAETAYLRRTADPDRFELRWFTPALEVPLCGHATLAAAHVLFSELGASSGEAIRFETRKSGVLKVERATHGYRMDFPATPATPIVAPPGLAEALGVEPVRSSPAASCWRSCPTRAACAACVPTWQGSSGSARAPASGAT